MILTEHDRHFGPRTAFVQFRYETETRRLEIDLVSDTVELALDQHLTVGRRQTVAQNDEVLPFFLCKMSETTRKRRKWSNHSNPYKNVGVFEKYGGMFEHFQKHPNVCERS